jgi:hypothetical protein
MITRMYWCPLAVFTNRPSRSIATCSKWHPYNWQGNQTVSIMCPRSSDLALQAGTAVVLHGAPSKCALSRWVWVSCKTVLTYWVGMSNKSFVSPLYFTT